MAKADPGVTSMYDATLVRPELQVRGGLVFTEGMGKALGFRLWLKHAPKRV